MKIKYFIFGLLVTVFSVINFSSASDLTLDCVSGRDGYCTNTFSTGDNNYFHCLYLPDNVDGVILTPSCTSSFYMNYPWGDLGYNRFSCGTTYNISDLRTSMFCIYDSKGKFDLEYIYPPILPGGQDALSGAILSISNSVSEFIPYLVYISLGILGALLGFVAIKWLINWLRSKILSPFK